MQNKKQKKQPSFQAVPSDACFPPLLSSFPSRELPPFPQPHAYSHPRLRGSLQKILSSGDFPKLKEFVDDSSSLYKTCKEKVDTFAEECNKPDFHAWLYPKMATADNVCLEFNFESGCKLDRTAEHNSVHKCILCDAPDHGVLSRADEDHYVCAKYNDLSSQVYVISLELSIAYSEAWNLVRAYIWDPLEDKKSAALATASPAPASLPFLPLSSFETMMRNLEKASQISVSEPVKVVLQTPDGTKDVLDVEIKPKWMLKKVETCRTYAGKLTRMGDIVDEMDVAVKAWIVDYFGRDKHIARLKDEIGKMVAISKMFENDLAKVYDYQNMHELILCPGHTFQLLAIERPKESLQSFCASSKSEAMTTENQISFGMQLVRLYVRIHEMGYVHFYPCPKNIFVECCAEGMSFKLGEVYGETEDDKLYLAPEVAENLKPDRRSHIVVHFSESSGYSEKADAWSVGCVLYYVATKGQCLFEKEMETRKSQKFITAKLRGLAEVDASHYGDLLRRLICVNELDRLTLKIVLENWTTQHAEI